MPRAMRLFQKSIVIGVLAMTIGAFAVGPVSAQVNPFQPQPEAPPAATTPPSAPEATPPQQVLPPPEVQFPQATIIDYSSEFQGLEPVAMRNGVVVLRAPESTFFLKDGEEFIYNGARYMVAVDSSFFRLKLPNGGPSLPELIEAAGASDGEETQTAAADEDAQDHEDLVVYERQIGRQISFSSL